MYAKTHIKGHTVYLHRLIVNAPLRAGWSSIMRMEIRSAIAARIFASRPGVRRRRTHVEPAQSAWRRRVVLPSASTSQRPWRAYIYVNGRFQHLGYFASEQEATDVKVQADLQRFGEFSFHRRQAA